ncbi:unnamed protein product [Adineta steineri]|uniref:SHSP domain-containing protein n=1 Tax=Adineta steineri TaxID=433720 RepID=A0A815MG09_9BILA|nr:unnamed protein product [Adineta steineri]CAF3971916.1 unnamed protein product [Adineta steineri]
MLGYLSRLPVTCILSVVLLNSFQETNSATSSVPNIETIINTITTDRKVVPLYDLLVKYPPTLVDYLYKNYPTAIQAPKLSSSSSFWSFFINPEGKSAYDFVVDLTRPTDIYSELKAYPLTFPRGKENYDRKVNEEHSRFVINVVGRYNVGKTYILRLLAKINLGDSFTERTDGISVALTNLGALSMALIDTAGTRTPVRFKQNTFLQYSYERQVSDSFIQEIAFNSAEIFILVVNQLTLDDQLYLKTLLKRLGEKYTPKEIKQRLLLVHNWFNLRTRKEIETVENSELAGLFQAQKQPQGYWLSDDFKHFVFADDTSLEGNIQNSHSVEHIHDMIKGAAVGQEKDILKKIIHETETILSRFLVEQPSASETNRRADSNVNYVQGFIRTGGTIDFQHKHDMVVELDIKPLITGKKIQPISFLVPKKDLAKNVKLSQNLRFNYDGSISVDYSSNSFIPDMRVATINEKGDIQIKIECLSCSANYKVFLRGNSVTIKAEKLAEDVTVKDHINTLRSGRFEVTVPLMQLYQEHAFDFNKLEKKFENGIITVTIPVINFDEMGNGEL